MTVFLSAGHSDSDPGATVTTLVDARQVVRCENSVAVEFRRMVELYLRRDGVSVATDGAGSENWPLKKAAAEARKYPLAIEIHCNSAASPQATGTECLSSSEDARLAAKISAAIAEALKIKDRGAKPENAGQHHRLAFVQAGGIIVELFFLSNPDDLAAYDARKWLAAKAMARVLRDAT